MRIRFLIALISAIAVALAFGTTYSAWAFDSSMETANAVQVEVPSWDFHGDIGFAKIENVSNCSYLTATRETSVTRGSSEAVRLTNTAGTQTKTHGFNLAFDRDYTLGEIKTHKIQFDYYHAQKREQADKGLPKVHLLYNGATKGSNQGGGDTANELSPFVVTNLDGGWWRLEYFVTSLCPTLVDHGDTAISTSQKLNGIKITDEYMYDYSSTTAFIVIDNFVLDPEPAERLGIFNRWAGFSAGSYFWFKVAWSGELHSCVLTLSDYTVAEYDTESTKSPFYIKGLKKGTVVVTATLVVGSARRTMSISNTVSVN